jgi:PucR C-terminal helix-turn-helix domain/GGDEF-like domain
MIGPFEGVPGVGHATRQTGIGVSPTGRRNGGSVDHRDRILGRLGARLEELAASTARAVVDEGAEFGPIRDNLLYDELRVFASQGISLHLVAMRRRSPPTAAETEFIRERSARRAHELVPMAAMLRAFLIANRIVCSAISAEAESNVGSLQAALELTALAFEYTVLTTSVMAVSYVETVRGDLAGLERQRSELTETVLTSGVSPRTELLRRARGLGLPTEQGYVAAVATARELGASRSSVEALRWAADAIARAGERPASSSFVVIRGSEVLAVLKSAGPHSALAVLKRAAAGLAQSRSVSLIAGIGPEFSGLTGLRSSYEQAKRALRHATPERPFLGGPDLLLFDELAASAGDSVAEMVSAAMRSALADPLVRSTLEQFVNADLNVTDAAKALHLHPNTLRYRLQRISERTGRDPRKLTDLLELIAAARVMSASGDKPAGLLDSALHDPSTARD